MAPRRNKRKQSENQFNQPRENQMPVWVPLPRPCSRGSNVSGSQYYMPMSPDMYLPPWASCVPPPYYTQPPCHCAHKNICTTSNCRNSAECVEMQPMFCPFGVKQDRSSGSCTTSEEEHHETSNGEEILSRSNANICASCGAPSNVKARLSDAKYKFRQKNHMDPCRQKRTQDSYTSPDYVEQPERDNIQMNSKSCTNSYCQMPLPHICSQEKILQASSFKSALKKPETSFDKNVLNISDGKKKTTNAEFGFSSGGESGTSHTSTEPVPMHNVHKTKSGKTDAVHLDEIPKISSKASNDKLIKKSECCLADDGEICKMRAMDPYDKADFDNMTHFTKKSECGCSDNILLKSLKLPGCQCASSKISSKDGSKLGEVSNCDCATIKPDRKKMADSDGSFDTGNDIGNKAELKPKTAVLNKSKTEMTDSICVCKFPPAYRHLSCNCTEMDNGCLCMNNNGKVPLVKNEKL